MTADILAPVLFETMGEQLPEYQVSIMTIFSKLNIFSLQKELKNVNAIVLHEILQAGQAGRQMEYGNFAVFVEIFEIICMDFQQWTSSARPRACTQANPRTAPR